MRFTKMHALGNDFPIVEAFDALPEDPHSLAVFMSDRKYGIGGDGLVLLTRSEKADVRMIMYNPDGTPAMCGNALRCVGKYAYTKGIVTKTSFTVETVKGVNIIDLTLRDSIVCAVKADIGEPSFDPSAIPCVNDITLKKVDVDDKQFSVTAVNVGNPHCVTFVNDVDSLDVARYGSQLEISPLFPEKTNVEFVTVIDRNHVKMRVWERAAGLTLACGTGCCATAAAGIKLGLLDSNVNVQMPGGTLNIEWHGVGTGIKMESDAEFVFDGVLDEQAKNRFERIYKNASEIFYSGN